MNRTFTKGKIFTPLIKFAIPVLFALFLQAMYGAVDLLVVGQFADATAVSAVSTGSQLIQTITVVIIGLSMGITILIGQKIGEKKSNEIGNVIGSAICIFIVIAIVISLIMIIGARPLSSILNAPQEALNQTIKYISICGAGAIFIVAYNLIGSIFRGLGDSKTPLITVLIACIINIIGDMLFVAVLDMKASGAAIATVLSQSISVLLCLIILKKRGLPYPFTRKNIRWNTILIKKIMLIGTPVALQDLLVSISFLVILSIVNGLGIIASAGVGVAEKIAIFIMIVPDGFMQSLSAFVAQNVGAREHERAKSALKYSFITSFFIGLILGAVSFFCGTALSGIFTNDVQVANAASNYLKAYSIDALLTSFLFCFCGFFNGYEKTRFVMIQGIVGAFLIRIPVSFLMSKITPVLLFYIGLATPASSLVQITLCIIYYKKSKAHKSI